MTFNEMRDRAYATAKAKGFHDGDRPENFGEKIALMHSELSEALEEHRAGRPLFWYSNVRDKETGAITDEVKPEGVAVELADLIIRVGDLAGLLNIDLDEVISRKMDFNDTRPHKHGKAY